MRPSVVILGFVLGSTAAISFALAGVAIVFGLLRPEYPRLGEELPSLLGNLGMFTLLTIASSASFYGQLRGLWWRWGAVTLLLAGLAFVAWLYWPR